MMPEMFMKNTPRKIVVMRPTYLRALPPRISSAMLVRMKPRLISIIDWPREGTRRTRREEIARMRTRTSVAMILTKRMRLIAKGVPVNQNASGKNSSIDGGLKAVAVTAGRAELTSIDTERSS